MVAKYEKPIDDEYDILNANKEIWIISGGAFSELMQIGPIEAQHELSRQVFNALYVTIYVSLTNITSNFLK